LSVAALRRLSIGVSALIVATVFGAGVVGVRAARHIELNDRLWQYHQREVEGRSEALAGLQRIVGTDGLARLLAAPDRLAAAATMLRRELEALRSLDLRPAEVEAVGTLTRLVGDLEAAGAAPGAALAAAASALDAGLPTTLAALHAGAEAVDGEIGAQLRGSAERGLTLVRLGLLVLPVLLLVAILMVWLLQRLIGEIVLREREVEERRAAQAALEAARREAEAERARAERASLVKSQFLATVSHELRTPLTSIRGSLGLVAGGAVGAMPAKAAGLVQIAHKNAERLVLLVNDILDIEKIEAGHMEFRREPLDLVELARAAVEQNHGYAQQYGVAFSYAPAVATAPVLGDRDRLLQVMANLLSNAAKFSPEGGRVEIAVAPAGERFRVSVRDRGPGIPADFRARVFERFAQADASDSRAKGGTGLGLSIARAIVLQMGGELGFDSRTGADSGTVFHFELPAHRAQVRGDAPARRRVLVCEDDADVAALLALLLEREGAAVDVARDAAQAHRLLAERRYDAATVDVLLPDEDGIALIRRLRAEPATRYLPVVVVSAAADLARRTCDGAALGIVDWLDKPIDRDRLARALAHALDLADARPPRVLHVEDDADLVAVVRSLLGADVTLDAAADRAAARQALTAARYDLVILDAALPDGSGLELIEDIRAQRPPPRILIFSARDFGVHYASAVSASLVKSRGGNEELVRTIRTLVGLTDGAAGGGGEPAADG